jgi:alginate O-acetyltransferase complex protein AlgI
LWHGAGLTFVIWGGLHGVFLTINHTWLSFKRRRPWCRSLAQLWYFELACLSVTQMAVLIGWVFFRSQSVGVAANLLASMTRFGFDENRVQSSQTHWTEAVLIGAGYLACLTFPNVKNLFQKWDVGIEEYKNETAWSVIPIEWRPNLAWAAVGTALLVVGVLAGFVAGASSPFLYFQF